MRIYALLLTLMATATVLAVDVSVTVSCEEVDQTCLDRLRDALTPTDDPAPEPDPEPEPEPEPEPVVTLGRAESFRISAAALRTVDHRGGLDGFLAKAADADLSPKALKMKREIAKAQSAD